MTYDQWKTTDPLDCEPEDGRGPTELELVYDQLHAARESEKRLRAALSTPAAWQILDKHGRWITLPGDWKESENIDGREYRPLFALPPANIGGLDNV